MHTRMHFLFLKGFFLSFMNGKWSKRGYTRSRPMLPAIVGKKQKENCLIKLSYNRMKKREDK